MHQHKKHTVTVTTSWDDGHVKDLVLAELLDKYDIAGTFYISPENREIQTKDRLSSQVVREMARHFEIGAHTMTHPHLTKVPLTQAQHEIVDSKKYLEEVTGTPISSFCYPAGYYSDALKQVVKNAGFTVARTVGQGSRYVLDPLAMRTTVHARTHRWHFFMPWDELAILMFERVYKTGGIFHLWGHSWEIDAHEEWHRLERVLKHISGRKDVGYHSNRQLV